MNVRNLVYAGILLAGSSIPTAVSAYEEQDRKIVERTTYTTRTTYHDGWVAEHNYKHRLRLGRLNPSTELEARREGDAWRSSPRYRE